MSEAKNISPLLDGFKLGMPMFERSGITCCPAIKEDTNKKYIVKIITVPPTQDQLDALLLAGAYSDPADAMEYFRRKGESLLSEAELLKKLSKLEGFLPYEGWQMEPITRRRLGYEVYLVGSYKRSLEKHMANHMFTHLEAVNLGLDLCAALSVCRQSGYLYVDLKPTNIYVSDKKEYRIGDLGFLSMDTLRYASLPESCYSPYSPPELLDPMESVNLSVDTYAVGMILYRLYNDGQLPFSGIRPEQPLPSPVHADYELAEIIMKAIHPDWTQRWQDPRDLGKAIASYMQKNRVNDIPITPFIPLDVEPEEVPEVRETKKRRRKKKSSDGNPDVQEPAATDTSTAAEEISGGVLPEAVTEPTEPAEPSPVCENVPSEPETQEPDPQLLPEDPRVEQHPEELLAEEVSPAPEESLPEEPEAPAEPELSEEVLGILSKADTLIAHEIPEDILYPSQEEAEDPFSFVLEDSPDMDDTVAEEPSEEEPADSSPVSQKTTRHFADTSRRDKFRKFLGRFFFLTVTCLVLAGGYWLYRNVYLQQIDTLRIQGTQNQITVLIDTAVDESRLTVTCTDPKGKQITEPVKGGKVVFNGLQPSTQYAIEVEMSGFHKLSGNASDVFTTGAATQILSFQAIAGSEDGSVKLDFTVDGEEPNFWNIRYSAEGEDAKRETITNHSTMITGLTVGKVYTFTIDGGDNFDLGGETQLQYMAAKLILAEDLTVSSGNGTDVTVHWSTPGDIVIESWNVRCYDGYGFEEQVRVTDNQALFTGLDPSSDYLVEVTASGMTQPVRIQITADPIGISAVDVDETGKTELDISWEYTGTLPEGGWLLTYSVDGSSPQVVECEKTTATIAPLLPGATYRFSLQSADGRTVFNNMFSHTTGAAEVYRDNGIIPENLSVDLLKTPAQQKWTYEELEDAAFTNTFTQGESVSIVLRSSSVFYLPGYETNVMYVFRNAYGNILTELVSQETYYWKNIWNAGNAQTGELTVPKVPQTPGDYVLELYFNGKSVAQLDLIITD